MLKEKVWIIDNFLNEDIVNQIIENMSISDVNQLDGKKEKHLVGITLYNYNVHRDSIRSNNFLKKHLFERLNRFYESTLNKTADIDNLNPLQLFTKSFSPGEGYYELHTEDPKYFGDIVFMIYLTDEKDGNLVLPSKDDAKKVWNDGFTEMIKNLNVEYIDETLAITPKRNRCVFMKVGVAHYVERCSGNRLCVSGWSFAGEEYYKEFYK